MSSIKLLSVRGIPIRIHITFPLALVVAAFQFGRGQPDPWMGALFGVVVTLLLFICVVLHELAHSLVAVFFGSEVKEIVLLPLGGLARMERMPERPYQELLMAVAGPVTSGLIGVALGGVTLLVLPSYVWLQFGVAVAGAASLQWTHLLPYLVIANLFLAGFNLIPAFPMDGGRVLRALLASAMPFGRATAIATVVGQGLAGLIGLFGLLNGDVFVMLIAIFVYVGAAQESQMVRVRTALTGLLVGRAFSRDARPVGPDDPLSRAVDLTLGGFQSDFPVCSGERLVGMLTGTDLLVGLREYGPQAPVRQAMRNEFPVVTPEDDLFLAHEQMEKAKLEAIPVVDGETFLGLLTQRDLGEVLRLSSVQPGLLRPQP